MKIMGSPVFMPSAIIYSETIRFVVKDVDQDKVLSCEYCVLNIYVKSYIKKCKRSIHRITAVSG